MLQIRRFAYSVRQIPASRIFIWVATKVYWNRPRDVFDFNDGVLHWVMRYVVLWSLKGLLQMYPTVSIKYMHEIWRDHSLASRRYNDVIMCAMASQITSITVVYSTVYSKRRSKQTSKLRVTGHCAGNSPMTGEFPAQRTSNTENVSIWWRHHGVIWTLWYGTSAAPQLCERRVVLRVTCMYLSLNTTDRKLVEFATEILKLIDNLAISI